MGKLSVFPPLETGLKNGLFAFSSYLGTGLKNGEIVRFFLLLPTQEKTEKKERFYLSPPRGNKDRWRHPPRGNKDHCRHPQGRSEERNVFFLPWEQE